HALPLQKTAANSAGRSVIRPTTLGSSATVANVAQKLVLVLTQMCRISNKILLTVPAERRKFPAYEVCGIGTPFGLEVALNIGDDSGRSAGRASFGRKCRCLCQLVLLFTTAGLTTRAQTFTSLSGAVLDPSGAAVTGAQVTISNEGTGT